MRLSHFLTLLFIRECTTKPSDTMVVIIATARVTIASKMKFGAKSKIKIINGSSLLIVELFTFKMVKQKHKRSAVSKELEMMAVQIFSFLDCLFENSSAIGNTLKRFIPIYKGSESVLKIGSQLVVVRFKFGAVLYPKNPKIAIDITIIGTKIRLVVVKPLSPLIIIKNIKIRLI